MKCCSGSAENEEVSVQWNFVILSVCGAEGKRFMKKYTIHESHRLQQRRESQSSKRNKKINNNNNNLTPYRLCRPLS